MTVDRFEDVRQEARLIRVASIRIIIIVKWCSLDLKVNALLVLQMLTPYSLMQQWIPTSA